jgi:rhodanese-related sulfurtransferase
MSDLIQTVELYQKLNSNQPPVVIDVRDEAAYTAGHIPGALHIPGDDLAVQMVNIPKDRPVVTY